MEGPEEDRRESSDSSSDSDSSDGPGLASSSDSSSSQERRAANHDSDPESSDSDDEDPFWSTEGLLGNWISHSYQRQRARVAEHAEREDGLVIFFKVCRKIVAARAQ